MLAPTVVDSQIVAGSPAKQADVSWQPTDSDGEPADPGVVVSVQVATSDGTELVAKETSTGTGTNPRTVTTAVTQAQKASPEWLVATWTDPSDNVLATTTHEIIGAPLLTLDEYKRYQQNNASSMTSALLRPVRREVDEAMCRGYSSWLNRSVLPRFQVEWFEPGYYGNTLHLHYPDLRRIGWARRLDSDNTFTTIDITKARITAPNRVVLTDTVWPSNVRIQVGYEHGYPRPPEDVKRAAAKEIYSRLGGQASVIDPRARTFQDAGGNTLTFNEVGTAHRVSDVEMVNALVKAHRWDVPGVA